jgi:hypothetical protein
MYFIKKIYKEYKMIQSNTKNKSFLKMHYILKEMGIKNNMFFLQLYDETLIDVDPLDEENLTDEQKLRVHIEISKNPWYFFREIIKIPMTDVKLDFELTRATLAILWSLINDLHSYIVIPRQCYKSYTVACFYTWLIYWGAKNFTGAFFAQNDTLVTQNLSRVKDIRESLPKYLNLKTNADTDNIHALIYRTPEFTNTITVRAPGMNEDTANNVGRGASTMGQWYDEFAFIPYIWVQYGAAIPAYSTVAKAAERNGSHHHIVITTTAGNKNNKSGGWAYNFFNSCAPFTELLYDKVIYDKDGIPVCADKTEIKEYIANNNLGQQFLKIEFQWYELSKPVTYLDEMKQLMPGLDEFARGVLNQWLDSNADHPLGQERVQELQEHVMDPVKIRMVDKIYVCKFYRDPEILKTQSHHIVFGMDCSGNVRQDYSTLVGVDVTNSEVVFTMRCNQYSVLRFGRAVAYILLYLFPKSILVPERNYVGLPVVEIIAENMGSSRIYKDEKDEKLGVSMVHNLRKIMYGDVLRVSVYEHGNKIHDKTIIDEIAGLITDKHGRIDHKQNGGHDDTLISYLYCRWFIMFCKTKRKYIDAIFFNSKLNNDLSEEEFNELAEYSTERAQMDFVFDGGNRQMLERLDRHRETNSDFITRRIKNSIDDVLYDNRISQRDDIDYINDFNGINAVSEDEIDVDSIADEYLNDVHEYGKKDKNGIDHFDDDDPEKVEKETNEKRDTSNDPKPSPFAMSFGWDSSNYFK